MLTLQTSSENRATPPAGTHAARCWLVADLGTQTRSYDGQERQRREVALGWVFNDPDSDGQRHEVVRVFAATLGQKSTLRAFLEGWRGRAFTPGQTETFDLRAVLGKACLLNVAHAVRGDRTYANVASASALPKGMAAPAEVETLLFDLDAPQTWGALERLPKFLREAVERSAEWQSRQGADPFPAEQADAEEWT
jgi:hypothetical protein